MKIKMLLVVCLGFLGIGCTTTASYDYDDSVDFNRLTTYAWVVESKALGATSSDDGSFYLSDISHRRMIDAIDNNLVSKGLTKVAPEQADVLVNYHAAVNQKTERDIDPNYGLYWNLGHYNNGGYNGRYNRGGYYDHYYPASYFGSYYSSNHLGWSYDFNRRVREYKEGTLMIDFINNQQGLIWRGAKDSRLASQQTPEQRTKNINDTVATILENFPPRDNNLPPELQYKE